MCGIVGAVTKRSVTNILLDGLKKLEYRGYDSAGIAVIDDQQALQCLRVVGKVKELESVVKQTPVDANIGIAHTRWATHGAPTERNTHPFMSQAKFALIHNGIIENHAVLRERLQAAGYQFASDTDTETAVHLVHYHYTQCQDLLAAVRAAVNELKGAYSLGIVAADHPARVIGVRQGAPLVVGKGQQENFIASDPLALLAYTKDFIYLEDDDIVDITCDDITIYNNAGKRIQRDIHHLALNPETTERGTYRHYMQKEIMEQPAAIAACLDGRLAREQVMPDIFGMQAEAIFPEVKQIKLVACGTSYHAALIARYWIETLAQLPCSVEVASEFRYRHIAPTQHTLFVTLSQSGETADTLAALRMAKKMSYLSTLVICNVPGSTMIREADSHFLTHAGVEIGVASTKAFITQLVALFVLALSLRRSQTKALQDPLAETLVQALHQLPQMIQDVLDTDRDILQWARAFTMKQHALFIGRNMLYPIALEGALKMKEISYIHAEGYPAGELKHGPLALVDHHMPVVAMVPNDNIVEKTLSNLEEVRARGGKLFVLTDKPTHFQQTAHQETQVITLPKIHELLTPLLYTVPLQLLAYHVAVLKGTDVDQPRNLAKSVTVE